jgi:hypothetical protein
MKMLQPTPNERDSGCRRRLNGSSLRAGPYWQAVRAHRIQQLTDVRVHLGENVGEIAVVGLVLVVRGWDRWHVHLRVGYVGKERFLRRRLPAHEIDPTLG